MAERHPAVEIPNTECCRYYQRTRGDKIQHSGTIFFFPFQGRITSKTRHHSPFLTLALFSHSQGLREESLVSFSSILSHQSLPSPAQLSQWLRLPLPPPLRRRRPLVPPVLMRMSIRRSLLRPKRRTRLLWIAWYDPLDVSMASHLAMLARTRRRRCSSLTCVPLQERHQGQDRYCQPQQEQGPAKPDPEAATGAHCPGKRDPSEAGRW